MQASCPIPISDYPVVTLAHGGGGALMHGLIGKLFRAAFSNPALDREHDSAVLEWPGPGRIAFTTDSFVVRPLEFPGGDIGKLAVCGTVNDLAMAGARPLWLSAGFILEEGVPMDLLWRVVCSMKAAAEASGVCIVTGDTKVVDKGKGDGIFINTAGVGIVENAGVIGPESVQVGDAVLVNGDLGRHGVSILAAREGLEFETTVESDCAPLCAEVRALLDAGIRVRCLRDLTRGGLATTLVEIAGKSGYSVEIDERAIPVREDVRGACEMLGLDPLYVANEGRFSAFVAAEDAARGVEILRAIPGNEASAVIGRVVEGKRPAVFLKSVIGARRVLDMLSGEQLPRIC